MKVGCPPETSPGWTKTDISTSWAGSRTSSRLPGQCIPGRGGEFSVRSSGGQRGRGGRGTRPYRGENIKAFIVLKPEYQNMVEKQEVVDWCREKMAAYKYPRIVEFIEELPKTASGKVLKRVLREKEIAFSKKHRY